MSAVPQKAAASSSAPRTLSQRALAAFDVTAESRREVVSTMLEGHIRRAASYWVNLSLAMGIATLGLVLGSTGVVIGAMLISPLMGPIVGLGMGLAVGSPLLVIRSLLRVVGSVAFVIASATLITLALPFQEVTGEIAARTSPTVLDLLVAIGCALAAALTTMRPVADSASTAAGTAIGIALVPPLCVVGFGLGTAQTPIASGAALLFTANFCAILLFATATFWLFGFNSPELRSLEDALDAPQRLTHRVAAFVRAAFGSRYSGMLRFLMPLTLLALVYLPLRQALYEVSWEVRVRTALGALLAELPLTRTAVRSQIALDGHRVHLRLVVVASAEQAAELRRTLATRAAEIAGVTPSVDVQAVPDVEALREATRVKVQAPETPPAPDVGELRKRLESGLARSFPAAAGPLLSSRLDLSSGLVVELTHLGPPLGASAEPLLSSALSDAVGLPLRVSDKPVPEGTTEAAPGDAASFLPQLVDRLSWLEREPALHACVAIPAPPEKKKAPRPGAGGPAEPEDPVRAAISRQLSAARPGAVGVQAAEQWSVRLQLPACSLAQPAPDAASPDAGRPEPGSPDPLGQRR